MIIVSQEKDTVVNFDNVQAVNIHMQTKNEICAWFDSNENNRNGVLLGRYENEERCKEILQEMIEHLLNSKKLNGVLKTDEAMAYALCTHHRIYCMPEE